MKPRYPWLWDTDFDNDTFDDVLQGRGGDSAHDELWAMARLIEYAPFSEVKRLLPREKFLRRWPEIASRVRSETRRRGMEFFHQWLREQQAAHG